MRNPGIEKTYRNRIIGIVFSDILMLLVLLIVNGSIVQFLSFGLFKMTYTVDVIIDVVTLILTGLLIRKDIKDLLKEKMDVYEQPEV